jgi:hypothetical protein
MTNNMLQIEKPFQEGKKDLYSSARGIIEGYSHKYGQIPIDGVASLGSTVIHRVTEDRYIVNLNDHTILLNHIPEQKDRTNLPYRIILAQLGLESRIRALFNPKEEFNLVF